MDVDTGTKIATPVTDGSSDGNTDDGAELLRGRKRSRSETNGHELVEHSEPTTKRLRGSSPIPGTTEELPAPVQTAQLNLQKDFKRAAVAGDLDELMRLLTLAKSSRQNLGEWNLPFTAAKHGHLHILKWLAGQGDALDGVDDNGYTLLQIAARHGRLEIMKWLAERGADLEQTDRYARNLVCLAATRGHLEVIEWLHKKGCDIDHLSSDEKTPLLFAAKHDQLEVVKWLVKNGCDINHSQMWGCTALIYAGDYGHTELAEWLIEQGVDVNHETCDHETPISWAIRSNHSEIVKLLLKKGVNLNVAANSKENPLLFLAIETGHLDAVELLIPLYDMATRSSSGQTPLQFATQVFNVGEFVLVLLATLKHPSGNDLLKEALSIAEYPLARDLLTQPALFTSDTLSHSQLKEGADAVIISQLVQERLNLLRRELSELQFFLGSNAGLTAMQAKAAHIGIVASLADWKVTDYPTNDFYPELATTDTTNPAFANQLRDLHKKINQFTGTDIDLLVAEAYQWEETHLIPVIENLFDVCLRHGLSDNPEKDIREELAAKGVYQPLAKRIATAWVTAWTPLAEIAVPLLTPPAGPTSIDEWENESLADLDPMTGLIAITPDSVGKRIDNFSDAPVSTALLQAFQAALRSKLDNASAGVLNVNDPASTRNGKALYADLINRQFHMLAQFWRG